MQRNILYMCVFAILFFARLIVLTL
jgi:hypothetical protein